MFNNKTNNILGITALAAACMMSFASCKKNDEGPAEETHDPSTQIYHLAFAVDPDGQSATYFQQVTDFRSGQYSFDGVGFQLHSTRTARPYSSPNGQYVYSYDYNGGQVYSYQAGKNSVDDYSLVDQINTTPAIGSAVARFTQVSDDDCMLHIVTSSNNGEGIAYDGNGDFLRRKGMGAFIRIGTNNNSGGLTMGSPAQFEILLDEEEARSGVYVSRIDAPAISNGKIYYGYARAKIDPTTLEAVNGFVPADANVLVMDYPSLTNPQVIRTNLAAGNTNGYRTPMAHASEDGSVYQLVSANGQPTKILKLNNGAFDATYSFNLSELVGRNTISNGWFYVGNGIGYVPFCDTDLGAASTPNWYVARVDLASNTAVVLNLPGNLWLQQYQYSMLVDGKFVMAIVPNGADGNFYLLDPSSTSANGFEVGGVIKQGAAGTAYIGVF